MKQINTFGTNIIDGLLVNVSKYNKGWNQIPKKYKTRDNFDMFCFMNYMGVDALSFFIERINKMENKR